MRAVILAGGKGTRLRPYTVVLPKPLMPVGEYPILEVIVRQLARRGFARITMAVNHQAEIIQAYFGDGRKWGTRIDYSVEDRPLSTMAPLKIIRDLPEDFLVMNGDILTDMDFAEFAAYHRAQENLFTISAHRREVRTDFGVLDVAPDDRLAGFREKPVLDYTVSMGIYMVSRAALDYIPAGRAYGFDHLMLDLIGAGRPAAVRRYDGYWLDIGRPDDYMQAIEEFDGMKDHFLKEERLTAAG